MFCYVLLCVQSSFVAILMGERAGCFALFVFLVSSDVEWLFLTVPQICLQFVIVAFPDHTHLL